MPTQYNQRFDFAGVDLTIDGGETVRKLNISYDSVTGTIRVGDIHGQPVAEGEVAPDDSGNRPIEWDLDGKGITATMVDGSEWFMYRRGCNCGG